MQAAWSQYNFIPAGLKLILNVLIQSGIRLWQTGECLIDLVISVFMSAVAVLVIAAEAINICIGTGIKAAKTVILEKIMVKSSQSCVF